MKGILYCVGVGPGDPEEITLKAVRILKEANVIAAPGDPVESTIAFRIACQAVPELNHKELLPVVMPMTTDPESLSRAHQGAASAIEQQLEQGKSVAFLTLGDPTVYASPVYVEQIVREHGFATRYVSGITSFCAAAAALGISLAERDQPLHIIPAVYHGAQVKELLEIPGNMVFMKSGRTLGRLKEALQHSDRDVYMVENAAMENETLYHGIERVPDRAGYLSLILAKEKTE